MDTKTTSNIASSTMQQHQSPARQIQATTVTMKDVLDLYIAFGTPPPEAGPGFPQHWLLILCPPDSVWGTYYHAVGTAPVGAPYEVTIEADRRVDNFAFDSSEKICTIPAADEARVRAACESVHPVYCQSYVVDVLAILEKDRIVPFGTTANYKPRMEPSPWAKADGCATTYGLM
ncbi:hypothetical protein BJY04DRAFT_223617 [Aspergillus karnatakaensis]|uniref:uncharacterized protein n=1 Tax=Aspergillus karnatakaensis TaxID=1810916 RepID=UPI003CCD6213